MTRAPSASSCSLSALAWSRVRVTTTVWPNSGRDSNQLSVSRRVTTLPTIVIAGLPMPARAMASARVAIVATHVR